MYSQNYISRDIFAGPGCERNCRWIRSSGLPVNGSRVIYLLEPRAIDCFFTKKGDRLGRGEEKKISPQKEKRRVVAGANSDEKPRQMPTRPSGRSSRRRRRLMISISERHLSLFLLLCDALIIAAHVPISSTAATVVILQRATWLSLVVCWAMLSGRAPVARYGSATHPILSSPSVNPN